MSRSRGETKTKATEKVDFTVLFGSHPSPREA
jgi:hypothetical protein